MAGTNDINVGRYGEILSKLLGMKEPNPAGVIATEIFPTFTLEAERPEWEYLFGGRLMRGASTVAAVAAQKGASALQNGGNTRVLGVVQEITICTSGTAAFNIAVTGASLATGDTSRYMDGRSLDYVTTAAARGSLRVSHATTAGSFITAAKTFWSGQIASNVPFVVPGPIVLWSDTATSTGVTVECSSTNQTFFVNWKWRERSIDPGELKQG